MLYETETEERTHLRDVQDVLQERKKELDTRIADCDEQIRQAKAYAWEHHAEMDSAERAANESNITDAQSIADQLVQRKKQVEKLLDSPYFGRIDFAEGQNAANPYYIGIHNFSKDDDILIYDWRAPVSSMFYDYEKGPAQYHAPDGTISGEITAKRQYKIADGQWAYMVDTDLNINDDVLQKELSHTTDDKMKNIVATIQQEQNAVIRNETAHTMLLQGVAGSGKTSIALHRVAFLLYRFQDDLRAENMMILSPNHIFSDYISDVLPELGEENIPETGCEELAREILGKKIKFATFHEQVASLLDHEDQAHAARIREKAKADFVTKLDEWIAEAERTGFTPHALTAGGQEISADFVAGRYELMHDMPLFKRLDKIAADAAVRLKEQIKEAEGTWKTADRARLKKEVREMFAYRDPLDLYKGYFKARGREDLFQMLPKNKLEYADVFPLCYLTLRTQNPIRYPYTRHLLVDEMQDYTAVQYAVLKLLFPCKMTILGDASQSVNPYSSSTLADIQQIFPKAQTVELCKSYRSTVEITNFAQHISRSSKLIPIERHGEQPQVRAFPSASAQVKDILDQIAAWRAQNCRAIGIICKTDKQAAALYRKIHAAYPDAQMLDFKGTAYCSGLVVTTAHVSKGLEFDAVLVPDVDADNYHSALDRCMLYIACTRAMHCLTLTHCGAVSPLLPAPDAV